MANVVADWLRAGIGYTFCRGLVRYAKLRIGCGLGLVTLHSGQHQHRLQLRIGCGLGLVTLSEEQEIEPTTLRIGCGLGLVTLPDDCMSDEM